VHCYFFFAAFLEPQTKSLLLRDMMMIVNFGKLKSDIIDHLGTERLLANQSDNMATDKTNTQSSMNAVSVKNATNYQTGAARKCWY
jgi:hypothetical protein